jgi:hypothetical protein
MADHKHEAKSLDASTYTLHAPSHDLPLGLPPAVSVPKSLVVHSDGIFHGLPEYDASLHNKTAIVAGANGISGAHMLRVMAKHPKIWTKVHSLSRRPPQEPLPDYFTSHAIDLYHNDPKGVAREFQKAGITHV